MDEINNVFFGQNINIIICVPIRQL